MTVRPLAFALLSLLAGGAGGAAAHLLCADPSGPTEDTARIESAIASLRDEVAALRGGDQPALAGAPGEGLVRRLAEATARLETLAPPAGSADGGGVLERIDGRLSALEERLASGGGASGPREPEKRRVTLAEAAKELGLTRAEEAELRRIYEETMDKACGLLATETETAADVRKELEAAKDQPGGR